MVYNGGMETPVVVWDWNGTLLDDVDAAVAALNSMLAKRGIPAVTRDFYRANFRFPSRDFYIQLGVDVEDWESICVDFHSAFAAAPKGLRAGAHAVLERFASLGFRQVLLSAHREDLLKKDAADAGIADWFEAIAGTDNLSGASKLERATRLVREIQPRKMVFVGDTLHDAEVARATSAGCVLLECGHQTPERLAAAGCPLAAGLADIPDAVTRLVRR